MKTILYLMTLLCGAFPVLADSLKQAGATVTTHAESYAFTEGPAEAPDGKIYFSDIPNQRIHVYDPATGKITVHRENSGRANGLMFDKDGALLACEGGNRIFTRQLGDTITPLAETFEGKKFNSPNDVDIDDEGGMYFTDPRYGNRDDMEMKVEGVYYLRKGGQPIRIIDSLVRPNGVILSNDRKTLYVDDNGDQKIWAYDVQSDGSVKNGRMLVDLKTVKAGGGDGMTMDDQGNIYLAGNGHVFAFAPDGKLIEKIAFPESPANCTFGGPDRKTLFATARKGFYSIPMNVRGRKTVFDK
ncbi:MAG: sugar lactone lactonase YvrE [Verrucomicrobiales bacterium]|jgi:sugar lactone lactonase YvrE